MLINYLKITLRNLFKNKFYALINIGGLAIGMACSMFILLWIQDERTIDNFHEKGDQLYQVYMRTTNGSDIEASYNTSALLPEFLKEQIPEIEKASGYAKVLRISQQGDTYESFQVGDQLLRMRGSRAGNDFFQMFNYPLLQGTPENALKTPNSIAISHKMANLLFGSPEKAYGKALEVNNAQQVNVSAVFKNLPSTASNQFDYLMNWDHWVQNDDFKESWDHFGTLTYLQLQRGADPAAVEQKLLGILDQPMGLEEEEGLQLDLGLQAYKDQYLYSNFENGEPAASRIIYVRLLGFIALFILFIASVNFTNLSSARSLKRSIEVGVRKVTGARKKHLVQQFLVESLVLSFIAATIASFMVFLLLPWFNNFVQKQIVFPIKFESLIFFTVLALVIGLIAGSYPAFFLASIRASKVLKGQFKFSSKKMSFQKGLIVLQFMLAILLIIGTIIVTQQTRFFQNKDLGYNRENIFYFPIEGTLIDDYLTFKEEASKVAGVQYIDRTSQTPHNMGFSWPNVNWEGRGEENPVIFIPSSVGYDFLKLMDISILEGRDFSKSFMLDSSSFIINELAAQQMGLEEPIGSRVAIFGKEGPIVGVVENFHTQSLHQSIQPTILDIKEGLNFGTVLVKTEPGQTQQALKNLEEVYAQLNPEFPFNYHFLEEEYAQLYNNEQTVNKLSNVFGFLAILLACLGLLGLSAFIAEQRTKEVGIRKVLGASVVGIIRLLSKDFVKLVLIAFLISTPIAYYLMDQWLQNFAYRIEIQWQIFLLAGIIVIGIALLTVGFQSLKAAIANPIDSLRNE